MVRLKRCLPVYLLCVVCLTGLLCKLHDLVTAAADKQAVTRGITMLTYQQQVASLDFRSAHAKPVEHNPPVLNPFVHGVTGPVHGTLNVGGHVHNGDPATRNTVLLRETAMDFSAQQTPSAQKAIEPTSTAAVFAHWAVPGLSTSAATNYLANGGRPGLVTASHSATHQKHRSRHRTAHFVKVGQMYVYAAFLDLRQAGQLTVRLFTLQHHADRDSLVCRVYDRGERRTLFAEAYKMCENHGKTYGGWIYSCVLPTTIQTLPSHVDVLPLSQRLQQNKAFTTVKLKTIPAESKSEKRKIGVCVPPLFGDVALSSIVNFIEMCKLLGADTVFLYVTNSSWEVREFLHYHSQHNEALSVVEWNMPEKLTASLDAIWYHGQLLAIQDCLYHNMDAWSYLLFMDLDEMLVPRTTDNWRPMLDTILASHKPHSVAAMSFKSVFFDPTRVPEEAESIVYFQHLHRTKAASKIRNKLMVQPLKVFELGIHHLSKALSPDYTSIDVSPDIALLHHYRPCVQVYEAAMKCYPTKKDTTMLRYRARLKHSSHRVITGASKLFA